MCSKLQVSVTWCPLQDGGEVAVSSGSVTSTVDTSGSTHITQTRRSASSGDHQQYSDVQA